MVDILNGIYSLMDGVIPHHDVYKVIKHDNNMIAYSHVITFLSARNKVLYTRIDVFGLSHVK